MEKPESLLAAAVPAGWIHSAYWDAEIRAAISDADPVRSNLKVTRVHVLLGRALQLTLGCESGANFHSWAVWGSRKAGGTVRQEDLDSAIRNAQFVAAVVGGVVGAVASFVMLAWTGWPLFLFAMGILLGMLIGGLCGRLLAVRSRRQASAQVLKGNRLVLDDIGHVSARYIELFSGEHTAHEDRLRTFLESLRPGPTETGGQDLLRRAFFHYDRARTSTDLRERQEASYFANCLVVLHEHIKLQPYIVKSMPFIIRRCVTERQMAFDVGAHELAVAHDVPSLAGRDFPPLLVALKDPELLEFLNGPAGWAVAADHLSQSRAVDWTNIRQRMGYVVQLFRSRHADPEVCSSPYSALDLEGIARGRVPAGRL